MMATDLMKMVEAWAEYKLPGDTHVILKAFAAEIKANREEIERLKGTITLIDTKQTG